MKYFPLFIIVICAACQSPAVSTEAESPAFTRESVHTDSNTAEIEPTVQQTVKPAFVSTTRFPKGSFYFTCREKSYPSQHIVSFRGDHSFEVKETYNTEHGDSIVKTQGSWMPSGGYVWLYKNEVAWARYKWKADTLNYFDPSNKKLIAMQAMKKELIDSSKQFRDSLLQKDSVQNDTALRLH